MQGIQGEPGLNGRVVDIFVNGESVVDSEGSANIVFEDPYEAGDNIVISEGIISAIVPDPLQAGEHISISEGIISAEWPDPLVAGDNINISSEGEISTLGVVATRPTVDFVPGINVNRDEEQNVYELSVDFPQNVPGEHMDIYQTDTGDWIYNVILPDPLQAGDNITISEGVISANIDAYA